MFTFIRHPVTRRTVRSGHERFRAPGYLLLILVLGLGTSFIGVQPSVTLASQGSTPGATDTVLVGMWQWNSYPDDGATCCGPEDADFGIFHADGTYVGWEPVGGTAIGIWQMTGERSADLLFVFTDTDPSLEGWAAGTATFTITIEIDESGDSFVAKGTVDVRDAGGVQLLTVPWSRPAVRVTFDKNPATGSIPATPVAATPGS